MIRRRGLSGSGRVEGGVDFAVGVRVSVGVRARHFRCPSAQVGPYVGETLRSHVPNLRLDGSEPVSAWSTLPGTGVTEVGVLVKYHLRRLNRSLGCILPLVSEALLFEDLPGSIGEGRNTLGRGRERLLRGWTQHAPARTASGTMCGASDPVDIAWCATGAAPREREALSTHPPAPVDDTPMANLEQPEENTSAPATRLLLMCSILPHPVLPDARIL